MRKSIEEIQGFEFDWLGADCAGRIALFSTAGAGHAPAAFLDDTDGHQRAIDDILGSPKVCEAVFYPKVRDGLINTWRLAAERGLYAFDADPNGGPYKLVAKPVVSRHLPTLPLGMQSLVKGTTFTKLNFERDTVVTEYLLASELRSYGGARNS
jgi:hypothetical protein